MSENGAPHCNHFVSRKKRFCRISVKPGEKYCGEHLPLDVPASSDKNIRVVCPLDRKHTCYAHNLKKHLKICNARPGEALPYIEKGVNSGKDSSDDDLDTHKLLSLYKPKEVVEVVTKINRIYEELLDNKVGAKYAAHETVEAEMAKPEHGDKSRKHLKQASAILGLLADHDLLKSDTCFVEFGAGRGQLSYWIAQAAAPTSRSTFLLIERSSPKHKRDNKLDKSEDKVQRIRADIADLVLEKVEAVSRAPSVVGVTKHLCGDATDLALRCLANVTDPKKVKGCIMTFCCHHRCRWTSYTGKDFFSEVGITKSDFDMMCGMSSWATCGTGFSRERNKEDFVEVQNERDKEIGLNRTEKEEVGRRSKSILNWGRLKYLERLGFKCDLCYYVTSDVSLENVCIVACRQEI